MTCPHIIVVDDEPDLRDSIAAYFRLQGFDVSEAADGPSLDRLLAWGRADAILLDVNMPGEDGFSIARRLRDSTAAAIVMLTARSDLIDRVVGLELGADDYVAKPFELRELLARVRAVLRRTRAGPPTEEHAHASAGVDSIWVPERGAMIRVPIAEIELIRADRDYATLKTATRSYMLRSTMDALEQILDPAELARVHRSAFVRLRRVVSVRRAARGGSLSLVDGTIVAVGPRYIEAVLNQLNAQRI
ncbi:response regulator [Sphingomonas sp. DT-51]|uniref:response regulator n=1 Tax=Sphingomonas sp. DT-51 TaxID=3396165 RepID=UPI003F199769